ncbi:MAG TPA: Ppx/GppA phosphatase family protein [Rhodospirillales bacterium]|nr:Ppx/GppA phosphatase family protein [Rhodospirillales bacterium]
MPWQSGRLAKVRQAEQARRRSRPSRRRRGAASFYGAVDLGTNNCRLLVARPAGDGIRVVDSFSRIVRLGEGLSASGRLSEDAIERALGALKVCALKLGERAMAGVRGVATEACRRARNSDDFLARVKTETGLDLETISTLEEACLILAGCTPLIDRGRRFALIFDIGGGSTEVMWIEHEAENCPRLVDFLSLPIGVVNLSERYEDGNVGAADYARIIEDTDARLAPFCERNGVTQRIAEGQVHMLGTSGTVTTLGALHLGLERYDRSRVDGLVVDFENVMAINARLAAMDWAERRTNPCIGRGRADLVVMGCAILEAVWRRWPAQTLTIADRGIREGLLLGMMAADGTNWAPAMELAGDPSP